MKSITLLLAVLILFASCEKLGIGKKNDSSTLNGSTDIPLNTVGNTFSNIVNVNGTGYSGSITISKVEEGIATVDFSAAIPSGYPILESIKPKYIQDGQLVCQGKFKMTDEGIMDYNNIDHKPFVLVKYDAEVGDKYTLEKSDGTKIVREVVRKSTEDDFYYGFLLIKTIDVEQSSNIPGVEKITYFTNHKFGLVAVRVSMEDGSTPQMTIIPANY